MSGTDVVLVVVVVLAMLSVGALAVTVVQLRQVLGALRAELEEFRTVVGPGAEDLSGAAQRAATQVDRLEHLIGVAGSVTETVDTATAATVRVLSSPVIKTAAMARGTRRAARRLSGSGED